MAPNNSPWTDARILELKTCVDAKLSAGKTAEAMGMKKNCVVGKAHRMGLKFLSQPGHKRKAAGGNRFNKGIPFNINKLKGKLGLRLPLPEPVKSPDFLAKSLFDLGEFECHFIQGEDRLYCGQPSVETYCPFHHKIMYQRSIYNGG